jgi:hypothetical protein
LDEKEDASRQIWETIDHLSKQMKHDWQNIGLDVEDEAEEDDDDKDKDEGGEKPPV